MQRFLESDTQPDAAVRDWILSNHDKFVVVDSLLRHITYVQRGKVRNLRLQLVVPEAYRHDVMRDAHESPHEGTHSGSAKTASKLAEAFWWPAMVADVDRFVQGCLACQRVGRQDLP